MKDFTDDLERTASRTREIDVNGTIYTIQCTDPYGHWHVVKCPHPDLEGTWTTAEKLERELAAYENKKTAKASAPTPKKKNTESLLA